MLIGEKTKNRPPMQKKAQEKPVSKKNGQSARSTENAKESRLQTDPGKQNSSLSWKST